MLGAEAYGPERDFIDTNCSETGETIPTVPGILYSKGNPQMIRNAFVLTVLILLISSGRAQSSDSVPTAAVQMAVRDSASKPLRDTKLVISSLPSCCESRAPLTTEITTTTDGNGLASFEVPEGVYSLSIRVRGVGHVNTGRTEFYHGAIARPYLPPLAAYGTVKGAVPLSTCDRDVTVFAESGGGERVSITPDVEGNFLMDNLPLGRTTIYAKRGAVFCTDFLNIFLRQEETEGVALKPAPEQAAPTQVIIAKPVQAQLLVTEKPDQSKTQGEEQTPKTVTWVKGTVRDEAGHTVRNATVYALASFQGSIRRYEFTDKAVTDADGHYGMKGASELEYFTATLVAMAPDSAPAWAWSEFLSTSRVKDGSQQPPTEPPTQDFILPAHDANLDVTVLRDGKPFQSATVSVYLEGANLRQVWALGDYRSRAPVEEAAHPSATTDASGRVSFTHLLPGRYAVYATSGTVESIRSMAMGLGSSGKEETAVATGIPVRVNQAASFTIVLAAHPTNTVFRIADLQGKPVSGTVATSFGEGNTVQWSSNASLDPDGSGSIDLNHVGLWKIQVRHRKAPIYSFPILPPYEEAGGTVALSAILSNSTPPLFTSRSVVPGSLRVDVQDERGKPVTANVQVIRYTAPVASSTTDSSGSVLFENLYAADQVGTLSDHYYLKVTPTDPRYELAEKLGTANDPWPTRAQLRGISVILQQKLWERPLPLQLNAETHVVVRTTPLRYVEGTISSSGRPGSPVGPWRLWLGTDGLKYGGTTRVDQSTGKFIAGPFPSGPVAIAFWDAAHNHEATATVDVDANNTAPLHYDIAADKAVESYLAAQRRTDESTHARPEALPSEAFMGMRGISGHYRADHLLTVRSSCPTVSHRLWERRCSITKRIGLSLLSSRCPMLTVNCILEDNGLRLDRPFLLP